MSPCACQDFQVTTVEELKSHFKHLSSQTISLVWGDAIRYQEVRKKVLLTIYNSQTMISPSEGRYDMLLLLPVGPSIHMTTYIQETGEQQRTAKTNNMRQRETQFTVLCLPKVKLRSPQCVYFPVTFDSHYRRITEISPVTSVFLFLPPSKVIISRIRKRQLFKKK